MRRFWFIVYNGVVLPLLWLALYVAALFKRKVRRAIRGRKNLFVKLNDRISALQRGPKRVWFHSSSLGEFEQAKPIIAELKRRRPDTLTFASFFSPSGYDHSRNYRLADLITYLPFDSSGNADRFVESLRPDAAVIVRYDVWPNHIWSLKRRNIPIFLANATMDEHSPRHLPLANSFHRTVYDDVDYILTVSERDVNAFRKFGLSAPVLAAIGDTRYDQVWQRSRESKARHILPGELTSGRRVLVVGSSWDSDEEELIPALAKLAGEYPKLLTILVPHEPNVDNIERIERELNGRLRSIRFSELRDYKREHVVIIDSVGILMPLYQYAYAAYVGGSFGQGVHNILEPASYGTPVVFGPAHQNSQEAVELFHEGGAFVAENSEDLYATFRTLLSKPALRDESGAKAQALVERNVGATDRFLSYLEKVL